MRPACDAASPAVLHSPFYIAEVTAPGWPSCHKGAARGSLNPETLRCAPQAQGHRPLIFSQWTTTLDVLEWLLDELRLPFLRLDGSTAVEDRLALVDQCGPSLGLLAVNEG